MEIFCDFNSIKVRLEPCGEVFRSYADSFQFHKGTIRTALCDACVGLVVKFQFHKGTIRTAEAIGVIDGYIYFNSIKVRLEPAYRHRG